MKYKCPFRSVSFSIGFATLEGMKASNSTGGLCGLEYRRACSIAAPLLARAVTRVARGRLHASVHVFERLRGESR